jgi:hypothetical protein
MLKPPPLSCPTLDVQRFESLLTSGGDERLAIAAETGRNRYGSPRGTAGDEAWFSSSTATAISPRGYDAALAAYRWNVEGGSARSMSAWFGSLRERLMTLFGVPGSGIVLSASGTELELLALCLARNILPGALTNVVIAPGETGRGVMLAASGRHFLGSAPFRDKIECGALLEGFETPVTLAAKVEIRDETGVPLSPDRIDCDAIRTVEDSIALGRSVLIHVLDCSKTNLGGLRRATASALMARHAARVLVVVDACQLRCSPEQIRADLRAGFMVMITGSKFGAGPPFAAALLLPPSLLGQLCYLDLPPGLFAYTAAEDWPDAMRAKVARPFAAAGNGGVGLRWEAALAELERLFALPVQCRDAVSGAFAAAVEKHVRDNDRLALVDRDSAGGGQSNRTIFPIVTVASGTGKRIFHVGQPVAVGPRSALRVCLSASQIVDVAEPLANGQAFEAAIAPLLANIDGLFLKWARVTRDLGRGS